MVRGAVVEVVAVVLVPQATNQSPLAKLASPDAIMGLPVGMRLGSVTPAFRLKPRQFGVVY